MLSDMSSDKSPSVNGSIEKNAHILGTHVTPNMSFVISSDMFS